MGLFSSAGPTTDVLRKWKDGGWLVALDKAWGTIMPTDYKQRVVDLLKSLETKDPSPFAYINSKKYIQHNLSVADGPAGVAALIKSLPPEATVNTIRVFRDGDFVFAHTEYNFFGPKIGFDLFRFEDGLIVEHWDNLQEAATETNPVATRWLTVPPPRPISVRPKQIRHSCSAT